MVGLFALIGWVVREGLQSKGDDGELGGEFADEMPPDMSTVKALFWFSLGLAVLLGSSRLLMWGAVVVAHKLGVADSIIGLSVIAFGTSLPELAASIVAALKKEGDLLLGNIVGSNIFNVLFILGTTAVVRPIIVSREGIWLDLGVMIGFSVLILPFLYTGYRMVRTEGAILVLLYCSYVVLLFW